MLWLSTTIFVIRAVEARVAFFFKQWGGRVPTGGGRELDGRTWDEYPQPKRVALGRATA